MELFRGTWEEKPKPDAHSVNTASASVTPTSSLPLADPKPPLVQAQETLRRDSPLLEEPMRSSMDPSTTSAESFKRDLMQLDLNRLRKAFTLEKVAQFGSVWVGSVGLETPATDCCDPNTKQPRNDSSRGIANYENDDRLVTGAKVALGTLFASNVLQRMCHLRSEGTLSSIVTACITVAPPSVFGLLGLRQSPQEWIVAGDGISNAIKMASGSSASLCIEQSAWAAIRHFNRRTAGMLNAIQCDARTDQRKSTPTDPTSVMD